jgi:hypothetical protein
MHQDPVIEQPRVPQESPRVVESLRIVEQSPVIEQPRAVEPPRVEESRPAPAPVVQQFSSPLMQETPLVDVTAANANAAQEPRQERQDRSGQRRRANHLRPYAGNKQDNRESKPEPEDTKEE